MKHLLENFAIRKCGMCGVTLPYPTPEEDKEAMEEYAKNFPNDPHMKEELEIVCDDCYNKMAKKYGWEIE